MVSASEPVPVEPDVAPLVAKPVPMHEPALLEVHESTEELPEDTEEGEAVSDAEIGG